MSRRTPALMALPLLASLLAAARPAAAAPLSSASAPVHQCFPRNLHCGDTVTASLNASECFVDEESYADFYSFGVARGGNVTVTLTSTNFTPSLLLFDPRPELVAEQDATGSTLTITQALDRGGIWRVAATSAEAGATGSYTLTVDCAEPGPPAGPWLTTSELPDFRFKVRITAGSNVITGEKLADCVAETLCVSGAQRDRAEVFVRVIGPRFNGFFWPQVIKFTTSQVEVWIEQLSTDQVNYYFLAGSSAESSDLPGLFDRTGFED